MRILPLITFLILLSCNSNTSDNCCNRENEVDGVILDIETGKSVNNEQNTEASNSGANDLILDSQTNNDSEYDSNNFEFQQNGTSGVDVGTTRVGGAVGGNNNPIEAAGGTNNSNVSEYPVSSGGPTTDPIPDSTTYDSNFQLMRPIYLVCISFFLLIISVYLLRLSGISWISFNRFKHYDLSLKKSKEYTIEISAIINQIQSLGNEAMKI